ncbi:MAG: FxLYD domain-containing protein [Nitrososphaeraceae archaeon]
MLSSSSFKDDLGYYHVVGEVKNNSTTDSMNYVKVVSTFYDNAGKVVGTDFTYTNVDVLGSAEKSSFEIILNDAQQSQRVSSYKLSVSGDKTQALPASLKLSVGSSHLDDIGSYHIVGEVTNQGNEKATFVKLECAVIGTQKDIDGR